MSTESILDSIADRQGWNDSSKLTLLIAYIENQGDDATFKDYLEQTAAAENEAAGPPADWGVE